MTDTSIKELESCQDANLTCSNEPLLDKSEIKNVETSRLNDRHYRECVVKRALNPEWIAMNARSMDASVASERLGYKAKSDGIWLEGTNGFGQFRPNKPWRNEGDKKAPKYRTATGEEYDAMLPIHPTNKQYWLDYVALRELAWKINGHPCLPVTEGMFKAICACSNDIPCVALAGVEQGLTSAKLDPQGRRYLVETLERLAREGFGFIIIFDADSQTNENVNNAQYKLAKQLDKFKVPVYISSGWDIELGKGMDDYIKNNGIEQFKREVMGKVVDLSTWEKQFKKDETDKKLPPKAIACELALEYRTKRKYDLEQQTWRRYNGKVWEAIHDKVFTAEVYLQLKTMSNAECNYSSYVENVLYFLQLELLEKEWHSFDRSKWIAFSDYVLEVETGKKHEHSPGFMFTSMLSHQCPKVAWEKGGDILELSRLHAPNFYAYAIYAQNGDVMKVLKMLAFINGTLTYQFSEEQMFMLLLGAPGAGKGTFVRILETAVGKGNHASAKLHRLGDDNVIAAIIDKQLVICPDEKKQNSDISGLLSLTGGDSIPYRQIYKPASSSKFNGSVVVVANNNPFVGDTTGVDRRISLLQFDNPIPVRDSGMEQKMQLEVGILISLALSMDCVQVKNLIAGVDSGYSPDIKRLTWLHKTDNDSVAMFVEEMLVPAPQNEYVMLGGKGDDAKSLYGAYLKMCEENNARSTYTKNNFRNHLLEICREVGWLKVRESRCGTGWRVYGVRLRTENDNSPRVSDWFGSTNSQCRECNISVDSSVDLKPLQDKESVDSVDNSLPKVDSENSKQPMQVDSSLKLHSDSKTYTASQPIQDKDLKATPVSTPAYTPTLAEQIMQVFNDAPALGKLILSVADTLELDAFVVTCTPEQVKKIKSAAKLVWRPGCDSFGEYKGEKCELFEFGTTKRTWKVRLVSGSETISVSVYDVAPWLGI
jgi:putative DNA primase/helicase